MHIRDLQLCGVLSIDVDRESGIGVFIFKGEMPDVAWSTEELKPSKEGYLEWVDLVDINKKPLVEDLYLLLPRVVSMSRSEPPFFAQSIYIEGQPTIVFADTEKEQTKTQRHSSR